MAIYGDSYYGDSYYGEDASGSIGSFPAAVIPVSLNGGSWAAASIPMALSGRVYSAAASMPMRLAGRTGYPAASLPMNLESADPAHFTADSASWGLAVTLGGVAVDTVIGAVRIDHEEDSSGTCAFDFLPSAGSIDPDSYERQPLRVSFVGLDAAGAELYRVRRYTGTVESASYDPDNGVVSIRGTTDLNGWLENLDRAVIDGVVGGLWSEHVFEDSADGQQYARDRLSTRQAEMHMDNYGRLRVVDWAAKSTADVELTDAWRFNDTLSLQRAQRRDLVTRCRINLDFRFVRLRHREITASWANQLGLCHYLDNNWKLATKDMVASAIDGTEWTRTSAITYAELPPTGTYCLPPRGWSGNATEFALGATWKAARRWAQTLTEEYTLTVVAPDLEETVGQQLVSEDYGIEATYDGTDYEQITDYATTPAGAVYNTTTLDWTLDAVAAETDGRAAMEAAQACVLAKSKAEILGRARRNLLTFTPVYRPDITLASTVRVNTAYLVAKGKVRQVVETLNPVTGQLDMELTLALSRHGGSGLASDDTLEAPSAPADPVEVPTDRVYVCGYHLGATAFSPADNEDWDGYIVNVRSNGYLYDAAGEVYRERFVVRMPEIEAAARDAAVAPRAQTYQVVVPEDELTMSA